MERLSYWALFAVGLVLAAWLPARNMFPSLIAQILQLLSTAGIWETG